jgi:hypothetical protein
MNWMTWIAPNNFALANITGSYGGMGFNPISTLDWNTAGSGALLFLLNRFMLTDRIPNHTILLDDPAIYRPSPLRPDYYRDVLGQLLLGRLHANQLQ